MRLHKVRLMTACMITAEICAANVMTNGQPREVARLTPAAHKVVAPLQQALQDVITILSKNNSCSRFFGDTQAAVQVLDHLTNQFQIRRLNESSTGIQMSGTFTNLDWTEEHPGYRLFAAATINSQGPFFTAKVFAPDPYVPNVGRFRPNTREARVLMLLHELAHLIRRANGSWLIPDEGNSTTLSSQNTALVESQCREQILALSQRADERIVWNQTLVAKQLVVTSSTK